jgi:hypothetical protein
MQGNFYFGSNAEMFRAYLVGQDLLVDGVYWEPVWAWGDACTAHQVIKSMGRHIFGKTSPERPENEASSVCRVNAGPANLKKAPGKIEYTRKVKLTL